MKLVNQRSTASLAFPVLFGLLFSLSFLYSLNKNNTADINFDELAFGADNTASIEFVNNVKVHCHDFNDIQYCLDGYTESRPNEEVIVWLGNSQLHTINQMTNIDHTASYYLHQDVANDSQYLMTFSQPNVNLQEQYLLFEYLTEYLPIKSLILPVVFDDTRETGIRPSLLKALDNENVIESLNESDIGQNIAVLADDKDSSGNTIDPLEGTLQKKVELFINNELENIWSIWGSREQFRGQFFTNIYFFRNWVLGINPSSIRKKIPGRYLKNMQAVEAILNSAHEKQIKVILYIPPLRNDVEIPYKVEDYSLFKRI